MRLCNVYNAVMLAGTTAWWGMFSGKDVPAVGVSFGIERMFNILEQQARERAEAAGHKLRESETQVLDCDNISNIRKLLCRQSEIQMVQLGILPAGSVVASARALVIWLPVGTRGLQCRYAVYC